MRIFYRKAQDCRQVKRSKVRKHTIQGYIISRTKIYDIFKLGEAHGNGGLYDRIIHQYKICYSLKSSEFFLRYLVICPREKEGKFHFSQIMEKEMLKIIDSKVEDSYSKEYLFAPKIAILESRLFEVFKSHSRYFTTAIKFFEEGFRIYTPERGFKTELQSFDSLPNLNLTASALLELTKAPTRLDDLANTALRSEKPKRPTVAGNKKKVVYTFPLT